MDSLLSSNDLRHNMSNPPSNNAKPPSLPLNLPRTPQTQIHHLPLPPPHHPLHPNHPPHNPHLPRRHPPLHNPLHSHPIRFPALRSQNLHRRNILHRNSPPKHPPLPPDNPHPNLPHPPSIRRASPNHRFIPRPRQRLFNGAGVLSYRPCAY